MASNLENLQKRRDYVYQQLADMESTSPGGKPDGDQIQHVQYRLSLYEELEHLDRQISAADTGWGAAGVVSEARG